MCDQAYFFGGEKKKWVITSRKCEGCLIPRLVKKISDLPVQRQLLDLLANQPIFEQADSSISIIVEFTLAKLSKNWPNY